MLRRIPSVLRRLTKPAKIQGCKLPKRTFASAIDDMNVEKIGFPTWEEAQRDSPAFIIEDDCHDLEGFDATKVQLEDGVVTYVTPGGEKVVLAHMAATLEWTLPSPPPRHCFEESPVVYDIE